MVVIFLIVTSLVVVMFMVLTDTRKNDNFKQLERRSDGDVVIADAGSSDGGGDGGGAD